MAVPVARRGAGRRLAGRAALTVWLLAPSWPGVASVGVEAAEPRTVAIVFAVDEGFRQDALWRAQLNHLIDRASRYYGSRFELRFELAAVVSWSPHGGSLEELLDDLRAQVRVEPGRIRVGLTAQRPPRSPEYGLASYHDAALVIAKAAREEWLTDGFLHELAHIFGALDVKSARGLMSPDQKGIELDPLNARLVALHRDRTFAPHLFPLQPAAFDRALGLYREAVPLAPQAASLAVTQLAIEKGDYALALAAVSEALAADPRSANALNLRGIALRRLGRVTEAIGSYREALALRPRYAQVHYNLAIAHEKHRNPKEALASYRRAVELQPDHARALSNLARLYAQQGEPSRAIECAERALGFAPDFAEARVNLALGYLKAENLERARREAGQALAANPNLAGAHEVMGVAWLASGRSDEALASLRAAAALEPAEPRFHQQLAHAWEAAGDHERARLALEDALKLDAQYLPALVDLADLHLRLGRRVQAIEAFLRVVALKPDDGPSHNNLAVLYFRLDDLARARTHVNRARELGMTPHADFLAALEAAERRRKLEDA